MEISDYKSYIPAYEKIVSLKAYKCSHCSRIYSTQIHANKIIGRIPLVMPCSHTICEECITRMTKTKNITCLICHLEMAIENPVFPIDRYMFGALLSLNSSDNKSQSVLFQPAGATVKPLQRKRHINGAKDSCSQQECPKKADWRCVDCGELYCHRCDKRVHESVRILRNHSRYPVDAADLSEFNVACAAHPGSVAEYSCISCAQMLCSKCVIKDHTGHEVISIEDKNAQEVNSFKDTLLKAKYVLKCMEATQKKVKQEISNSRGHQKPSQIEYEIIKHFSVLHSRLQLLEASMLERFYSAQAAKVDTLQRLSVELESNIEVLAPMVATGAMVVATTGHEHLDKLLISELDRKITTNLGLPCELAEQCDNVQLQFVADASITEALQNHCRIVFEESLKYTLSPMTDFSERNLPAQDDSTTPNSTDTDSVYSNSSLSSPTVEYNYLKNGCKTRVSLAGSVPTFYGIKQQKSVPKSANEPVSFTKDSIETVTVTHLKNPSLFYVQLARKKNEIDALSAKYEIYADHAATPTMPEIGKIYIVQYVAEKNSKWYRATIKDVHIAGIIKMFEVFYLDYGNTAVVPLNKIREIKPIFMNDPPFAYKCCLHRIVSQRNEWNDDVLKYMIQFITANNNLKMRVVQYRKDILDVDLISYTESLSDALIFVGYAQSTSSSTCTSHTAMHRRKSDYTEKKIVSAIANFKKDKVYKVAVTHVVNPDCLYVQLFENKKVIKNLDSAMSGFYEKHDQKVFIFKPEKGMSCAAKLSASGKKWWRVEILDLPGDATVIVYSLDYGITEKVQWDQLRRLKDHYRSTDAQAIKVKLSDIIPATGNDEWTEETNSFLEGYMKDKVFSMYVNQASKEQLLVTLYETSDESDICMNALLVRKNLAESTGESSLLVEFHKIFPTDVCDVTKKRHLEHTISNPRPAATDENPHSFLSNSRFFEAVDVLHIDSPSCFYVSIPKWTDEKLKLFENLSEFYSKETSPKKSWEVDAKCVIRSTKDNLFYRGIITKVLGDDMYEVFLKDIIRSEIVATNYLYELDDSFGVHDFTIKCRLGGMRPTGGCDTWSKAAVEYFRELVSKYGQLYVTKLEPVVDKTLSVNLTAIWEENKGPLEPSSIETIVLNSCILDAGLALPVKIKSIESTAKDLSLENNMIPISTFVSPGMALKPTFEPALAEKLPASRPTRWLHSSRITEKQFKAWPSYVDHDGFVYLHTARSKSILLNLRRMMDNHFKKTLPDPPHHWEPGQMCTVQYHLDKSFCRGTVTNSTGDDKIFVKLLDYGNDEEFRHDELRSEIMMADVPALTVKCALANVHPKDKNGQWPEEILDTLHYTLVEKECQVFLDEDQLTEEIPQVQIYINNICINTTIMEWDWNKTKSEKVRQSVSEDDDNVSVVIEEQADESSGDEELVSSEDEAQLRYKHVSLPKDQKSFRAIVINIIDFRSIIIEADFMRDTIETTAKQFERMQEEINGSALDLPLLVTPSVGEPCVALYGSDNTWYRAEILAVDKTGFEIKILFIDYGNVEVVPLPDMRQIRDEWLAFPVQMLRCQICGIQNPPGADVNDISMEIRDLIVDKNVICHVKKTRPVLEVALIDPESFELMYKKLIDDGMLLAVE